MDGYEKFWRETLCICGTEEVVPLPADYMDTVLYVLNETNLKDKWVDVVMRSYGIGGYGEYETNDIAKVLGVSTTFVRDMKRNLLLKCRCSYRKDILIMGITEYRKKADEINNLIGSVSAYQKHYQQLKKEHDKQVRKAKEIKLQMDKLVLSFQAEHGLGEKTAKQIAKKNTTNPSDILEIFRYKIFHIK